jgi:hypothetical protein
MTSTIDRTPSTHPCPEAGPTWPQKAGGAAAIYLALALLGAIPYFLLVVDYPGATTASDKVDLVVANYSSMYAAYLASYVLFGMAVAVLALALHDGLAVGSPLAARVATAVGLMWSFALVLCGMVFTYGMTTIVDLHETDPAVAVRTWRAVEPVALALGGAGGELLGGLWVLLLSLVALRSAALPRSVAWLGIAVGVVGLSSVVPALHDATIAFGLLQLVWFLWLGLVLVSGRGARLRPRTAT